MGQIVIFESFSSQELGLSNLDALLILSVLLWPPAGLRCLSNRDRFESRIARDSEVQTNRIARDLKPISSNTCRPGKKWVSGLRPKIGKK